MAATICTNCLAGVLEESGGVYVCNNCGVQANVTVEATEFQAGVDDIGWRRTVGTRASVRVPTMTVAQEEEQAQQQLTHAAFLYVQCLQVLLQAQASALVDKFNCPAVLESIIRQLWLSLLPTTQLLEPDFGKHSSDKDRHQGPSHQPRRAHSRSGSEAETNDEHAEDSEDEGRGHTGRSALRLVKPNVLYKALWQAFPPARTLQLCWLACHILRQAVCPWDIISWAQQGLLPYLQWQELCKTLLQGDDNEAFKLPPRCLQPGKVGSPGKLLTDALILARQLDLPRPLPPLNAEALLMRAATELQLPQVVMTLAMDLHVRYLLGTPALQLDLGQRAAADGQAYAAPHAALLVALKLLYGLGQGHAADAKELQLQQKLVVLQQQQAELRQQLQQLLDTGQLQGGHGVVLDAVASLGGAVEGRAMHPCSSVLREPVDWVAWAAAALQRILASSGGAVAAEEVLHWPSPLRAAYLQFYHDVVCAGSKPPAGMQPIHDMLWGWAAASLPSSDGAAPAPSGSSTCDPAGSALLPEPVAAGAVQARSRLYQLNQVSTPTGAPDYVAVLVVMAASAHVPRKVLHETTLRLEQQLQATESVIKQLPIQPALAGG